ncbi:MAG: phosphomannomutase/phosphoglucomutase [Clostridiales bacterium]|nr:phosphomannomutase/phosphoglucomutase [Clostridiales bacterium]
MSIYKDCDIRGIYPTEITEDASYKIGRALATMNPGATLRVGGDVRVSTPALKEALIRGLVESGATVYDLGITPTPALYYALANSDVTGGATVTASHNPPKYNGIKFMIGHTPVNRQVIDALKAVVDSGEYASVIGSVIPCPIMPEYMASLKKRFTAKKPLHVVVDAGNGAMSDYAPEAFRQSGYNVTELFCTPDGTFPNRDPNPAEYKHLSALCAKVKEAGADFGVAFDGDGDRAVFVDETGTAVINEKSLVLFIRTLLKDNPTPVVYDQKSSSAIKKATLAMGGEPVPERSGHAFIKRHFLEVGAAVAGEVSGHFFFGELGYDDGLFAALMMADIIASSGKTLSQLTADIVCPPITPDLRMFCPYSEQTAWLDRIEALAKDHPCEVAHLDGVRLEFEDGWLLARKSVTAEQITLRAEAETPERLNALLELVASVLPESARESIFA